ncbi:hypothetical protein LSTR_LSTR001254 [Laodelphax striatellus]|uniref:Lipocalin/cytosolic fatty-acid binding domain-containing protein n=1 Tax=Laodelphax striatellus TaxID=195883 RepID=A0A482XBF8_LAOST|nr:hypothetical protein LSTR_LSTR001254 [Laodelphax striatellus]
MKKTGETIAIAWLILFMAYSCHGHFFFGNCPYLEPVDDFNLTSLEGTWYEIESTGSFIESSVTRCNTPMFSLTGGKNFEFIYTRKIWTSPILISTSGSGRQIKEGRLQLTYRMPVFNVQRVPFIILDYQPNDYILAWSCTQLPFINIQRGWILSSKRSMKNETLDDLYDVIEEKGLSRRYFVTIVQDDCDQN